MYSLSTSWNSHRHVDGRAMLQEIRDLGFDYAELSHGIRVSLLPGIFAAVEEGWIRISSVHNFCPLPLGFNHPNPNIFKFSTRKEREWKNALRYSLRTLETAKRVRAGAVVLHLGQLPLNRITSAYAELARDNRRSDIPVKHAVLARERVKTGAQDQALALLTELAPAAKSAGILLGIETREALEEIPLEPDFPALLSRFPPDVVGYWHDTGHAQIKENLGFLQHWAHLESLRHRLIGWHLHDVVFPANDHRAPGTGSVDFRGLARFNRPGSIKVVELSPAVSPVEVQQGLAFLKSVWGND